MTEPTKKRKFRVKSTQYFLTYSKALKLTKQLLTAELNKLLPTAEMVIVSEEKHKDGTPHFHVYIKLSRSLETENSRFFDIMGYHPNIQSKIKKDNVIAYILKEDVKPETIYKLDTSNPLGFKRRKGDYEAWLQEHRQNKWTDCILKEVHLNERWVSDDGTRAPIHRFTSRDGGGMVLIGPSGIGKTTMVLGGLDGNENPIDGWLTTEMSNVYLVGGDKSMYHFESYQNQAWIIYDDVAPDPLHLLKLLQYYPQDHVLVPGAPRYQSVRMRGPARRNVVVLLNQNRDTVDWKQPGLDTRFRVYRYKP